MLLPIHVTNNVLFFNPIHNIQHILTESFLFVQKFCSEYLESFHSVLCPLFCDCDNSETKFYGLTEWWKKVAVTCIAETAVDINQLYSGT